MIKLGDLTSAKKAFDRRLCTKHRHDSEGAALAHVRSLRRRDGRDDNDASDGRTAFECSAHGGGCPPGVWHIGRPTKGGVS